MDKEKIRETVRDKYGSIARRSAGVTTETSQATACCGTTDIQTEILPMASCCAPTDQDAGKESASTCCGTEDFSVENMAAYLGKLGYTKEDLENVPEGANMMLGCGNPVALASLKPGEAVVDLGCGGGFDCFLAAKEVGETGRVIGVDMTPDMISKARKNAEKIQTTNVEFRLGEIEHLPIADNTVDIIMSNCVINLSPDKQRVYSDAYRVLKPGGRLAISDVVATAPLPDEVRNDLALLSACIGGAATIEDTEKMLKEAGFVQIKIVPHDKSREIIREWNPEKSKKGWDYVVSAYIEACKPS
ncbi:MAG: arsenite methyltransferase [Methanomicrobiales archaeon]|jgi:SAM-dependent methyltransferase|nr:arsenite methyltransferase [Methanomicrobiales archaeon]